MLETASLIVAVVVVFAVGWAGGYIFGAREMNKYRHWARSMFLQVRSIQAQVAALRETLQWLDRRGGLGHDAHARIQAALKIDTDL